MHRALVCVAVLGIAVAAQGATRALSWSKGDTFLALKNGDAVVWQYNFVRKEGKPYLHPLGLLDGTALTELRPSDHYWHRAFWHSWKSLNGLNYWEEDKKTGLSAGRTDMTAVQAVPKEDFSATIHLDLRYFPPGKPPILTEKRTVSISAPDAQGRYWVDWTGTFTAGEGDVEFQRTPIPGQPGGAGHGGYAGLGIRFAAFCRPWQFFNSEGATDAGRRGINPLKGKKAKWVGYRGKTPSGADCTVAVFDHPDNFRFPNPWALYDNLSYLGTGFIHDAPYTLPAGKSFTLRYRTVVCPGGADQAAVDALWEAYATSPK